MVISNSSWVRPAQAIIYTESGETKLFPPRNRGNLPRALTFRDHQEWKSVEAACPYMEQGMGMYGNSESQRLNKTDLGDERDMSAYSEDDCLSYLITTRSEKCDIDDPPDEYQSFEHECFKNSQPMDGNVYMSQEVPSISTPTEQYSNLLRHKRLSLQPVRSPNLEKSDVSDSESRYACNSPLLHTGSEAGSYLPLNDLVELYTKKMEVARIARLQEPESQDMHAMPKENKCTMTEQEVNRSCPPISDNRNTESASDCSLSERYIMQGRGSINFCSSLQLMAFDIHILLEELDVLVGEDDDWLCISTQELESLLINCCRKTVEYVMAE